MDRAVLVVAAAWAGLGILWLGGGSGPPLQRLLLRPALMGLLGLLLLVLSPGLPVRWPYAVVASAALTGLWEAYAGVYSFLKESGIKGDLATQVRVCAIWLVNALGNLVLLNLSALLAYPATFSTRGGPSTVLDVSYLTVLTFASAGYGDVLPNTPLGKMLVMLTSLAGLLYATILFAAVYHAMRED